MILLVAINCSGAHCVRAERHCWIQNWFSQEYKKFLWHFPPNQKHRINVAAVALKLTGKAKAIIKFNFDVINLVIFLPLFAWHSMTTYANQIARHSSKVKRHERQSSEDHRIVVFRAKFKSHRNHPFPIWSVGIEIVAMTASSVPSVQITSNAANSAIEMLVWSAWCWSSMFEGRVKTIPFSIWIVFGVKWNVARVFGCALCALAKVKQKNK